MKRQHELPSQIRQAIEATVELASTPGQGGPDADRRRRAVEEMIATSLQLLRGNLNLGEIRLIRQALREMRAGFEMFSPHRELRKIAVFGSARTPPDHPDYKAAFEFTRLLSQEGWMAITGAGPGIMQAGIEGPTPERAFGLCIRLPFEARPNPVIANDPKLLSFRYYFTRKLSFMGNADAVAAFPGGFGTQDELFEALTLVQCGRSAVVPIVLVEGEGERPGGGYWKKWESFVRSAMLETGWISSEDECFYEIAQSPVEAVKLVTNFYSRYRSSRYVDDLLVIRLDSPLGSAAVKGLAREFAPLISSGTIEEGNSLDGDDAPDGTARIWFRHNRRYFGEVRRMINRINAIPRCSAGSTP